jgi:hypothetical protein
VLEPNWSQPKPSVDDAVTMCSRVQLSRVELPEQPFNTFVESISKSHRKGGIQLVAFDVGVDSVFDWFASRNRLTDFGLLDALLVQPTFRQAVPTLNIPDTLSQGAGFDLSTPFILDGALAQALYHGGAYHKQQGDGKKEKELANAVCDAMFGGRFAEVSRYTSHEPWTPWFCAIAWDSSDIVFDRRIRRLWLIAITDTD